jgi:hypothetical protein
MKIAMSETEADALCDALSTYVRAIVQDATADAGDSQGGFAESYARKAFVSFLTGASLSMGNRGADDDERTAIERLLRNVNEQNRAEEALKRIFFPKIQTALDEGRIEEARGIVKRMPGDSVTTVFAMDMIRQAVSTRGAKHFADYVTAYMDESDRSAEMIASWDRFVAEVGKEEATRQFWAWQRTLPREHRSSVDPNGE